MMRRMWAWLRRPWKPDPVVVLASNDQLTQRVDRARLVLLSYLDGEADQWPEDRNVDGIILAVDVLRELGVRLSKPEPGGVPAIPGRSS